MRILYTSSQYPGFGGASTETYEAIRQLRKLGHEVTGVFVDHCGKCVKDEALLRPKTANWADPGNQGGIFGVDECSLRGKDSIATSEFLSSFDIHIGKNWQTPTLFHITTGPNVYLTSGIDYISWMKTEATNVTAPPPQNGLDLNAFAVSDRVIVHSTLDMELIKKLFPKNAVDKVWPDVIFTPNIAANIPVGFKSKPYHKRQFDICFSASMWNRPMKNRALMEDLIKQFPTLRMAVVGKQFESKSPTIKAYGLISHEWMITVLNDSRIVVIPSLYDPSPNLYAEAVACGCNIVVSTNVGNAPNHPWGLLVKKNESWKSVVSHALSLKAQENYFFVTPEEETKKLAATFGKIVEEWRTKRKIAISNKVPPVGKKRGTICIALTDACDLNCIMCGSQIKREGKLKSIMSDETWKAFVEKIPSNYQVEINSLGEHSLHPRYLDFLQDLADRNIQIKLSTNGMFRGWDDGKLRRFVNILRSAPSAFVTFSIDSGEKDVAESIRRGSDFDRVISNLNKIIQWSGGKITTNIMYCLMKKNLYHMHTLMDKVPGLNEFYINMLLVHTKDLYSESLFPYHNQTMDTIKSIIEYAKQRNIRVNGTCLPDSPKNEPTCSFPYYLWMDTEGKVYPCCRRFDLPIGDIKTDSIEDISKRFKRIDLDHDFCKACLEPVVNWSWRKHFGTKDLYLKFVNGAYYNDQRKCYEYQRSVFKKYDKDYLEVSKIVKDQIEENHTGVYSIKIFHQYYNLIKKDFPDLAHVLEIGAGQSKTVGKLFGHAGVNYTGIEPLGDICYDTDALYVMLDDLSKMLGMDKLGEKKEPVFWDSMKPVEDDSQDAIFSNAVLEHVTDMEYMTRQIWRVLKPGGLTYHQVDLRNHTNRKEEPDAFRKFTKEEWVYVNFEYSAINRLLPKDYEKLFRDVGFEIVKWTVYPDGGLQEGGLNFIARKPLR